MMCPTRRGIITVITAMPMSMSAAAVYARRWRRTNAAMKRSNCTLRGKTDLESRAATRRVGDRECARVRERDFVGDGESEPRSTARRVVASVEPLHDAAALRRRDAAPRVLDDHGRLRREANRH